MRLERRVLWLVLAAGVMLFLSSVLMLSGSHGSWRRRYSNLRCVNTDYPRNRSNVIILSSVGRSGSSLLGDLVAMMDDSFYYFEPMMTVNMDNATREETLQELRDAFLCNIRANLFSTSLGRVSLRVSLQRQCTGDLRLSQHVEIARHLCNTLPLMVVKTIRTRLEWLTELMEEESLGLRVLHLVRDPRPVRMSTKRCKWNENYINNACNNTLKDFNFRITMQKMYPGRYLFLRYEDLVKHPYRKAREISQLLGHTSDATEATLYSRADLPPCLRKFIAKRITKGREQHWRSNITQEELTLTEEVCRKTITRLGYNIFNTVDVARDLTNPLLMKEVP